MGIGIMIEISEGPGQIQNATFQSNTGPAIQVAESMNLTIQNNALKNYIDLRDMQNRAPYHINSITIKNNHFQNTFLSTSLGPWPKSAAADKHLTIDQNTYETPQGTPLIYWGNIRALTTLQEIRHQLNIEPQGTNPQ